ncbi:DDB1- and CUL4-associated factor 8-like [Venturia canescens]|uniref:DDB1- and CUL4-associated factor 8-like n=1 Tax=Venturia canescens TaxID=32260 RepID=UPI001C9D4518|nr:DDB1- and CUL4-associated factor 8-like [Venturia canescens]XP_043270534.1 DDB1- and CUL4-associated factor 8-like [Venturia canescens]XP_043270535.1 DDB1- and CUL4-associated factor 8-like [Venturia canescens]
MEKNVEEKVEHDKKLENHSIENLNDSEVAPENQASTSSAIFNRSKRNTKRRSYRQKNSNIDENNSNSSNVDDSTKPSSSITNLNESEEQTKLTSCTTTLNGKDTSTGTASERNKSPNADCFTPDGSDTSSIIDSDHERKENSDDWTTSEEEKYLTPTVLSKVKPKPTLNVIKEIVHRQIRPGVQFERKFYGSLYMVERLQYLHSLEEHRDCVNTVEFNAQGNLLVSGSDDLEVIVWNWATGRMRKPYYSGHRKNIFQASWLPRDDLSMMVTCSSDGQVRLLDLNNGTTRKLAAHRGPCNRFAIHPEYPNVAISVGDDGKILSIDVRDGETSKLVTPKEKGFSMQLYTIQANPQNCNEFCIGGHSEFVRIYDRRKAKEPTLILRPKNLVETAQIHVTAVAYNYNGTEILASYNNDDIYLFDTLIPHPNGDYAHKYQGHRNNKTIKGVNYFGPESEFIVSGSDCGNIYIWEKNTEAIVQYLPADAEGVVNCVKPHPHIPILASSGLDSDVKIWIPSAVNPPSLLTRTGLKESVTANLRDRMNSHLSHESHYDNLYYELTRLRSNNLWNGISSDED